MVGAAICATGFGIAYVTGYTVSAAFGGVVVAGAGSIFSSEEKPSPYAPPIPDPSGCSKSELAAIENSSYLPQVELPSSVEAFLVTDKGIWANGQFFSTDALWAKSPLRQPERREMDWQTFTQYASLSQRLAEPSLANSSSYRAFGESALALGQYGQAVGDFGKAVQANPNDAGAYLKRGAAYFGLGEYTSSLNDYQEFVAKTEAVSPPPSLLEFSTGFAKGLPRGVYESGEGILLFLAEFVQHPIQTSKQVIDSVSSLVTLIREEKWESFGEALSPEMHQLVTEWESLSSEKRGELAGYALGKHGADILAPGAFVKLASKSVKGAQELAAICKNLQIAQETLVLEAATGIGNGIKIAEVIETGQATARLAEELGFAPREMGQLKQAGKLEATVADTFNNIAKDSALYESLQLFDRAQEFLKAYKGFMPEAKVRDLIHQAGIKTFPRPMGLPENFKVRISDRGAGMEYIHPTNNHIRVRVMPGKPHSPLPYQQKPYVIEMKEGNFLDKYGNIVNKKSPGAHIPFEEFIYKN